MEFQIFNDYGAGSRHLGWRRVPAPRMAPGPGTQDGAGSRHQGWRRVPAPRMAPGPGAIIIKYLKFHNLHYYNNKLNVILSYFFAWTCNKILLNFCLSQK